MSEQLVYGNRCPVCDTALAIPNHPEPASPSVGAQELVTDQSLVRGILDAHMRELDGNCFCGFRTSGKPGISAEEWLEHVLPFFGPAAMSQTSQQTMCSADIGKMGLVALTPTHPQPLKVSDISLEKLVAKWDSEPQLSAQEAAMEMVQINEEIASLIEFYSEREMRSPSNSQEAVRDARERLHKWQAAAAKLRAAMGGK